ncbi:MAG: HAD family hydrolase [Candidatus Omnitrophota bacterium]
MIKAIIFDFDGVIVDSNHVKTDAFVKLFRGYPASIRELVRKYHLQNGGMSRFDKFRHIYADFIKEPLPKEKFDELCGDFNRLVMDGVIKAPFFDGVIDFLERNRDAYAMYIVSGTPDFEIKEIVRRRGLDKYFIDVYGSPRSKKELIEILLAEHGHRKEEAVFVGDSINDYEGAVGSGVGFIAKIDDNLGVEQFPGVDLKISIKGMAELGRHLDGLGE